MTTARPSRTGCFWTNAPRFRTPNAQQAADGTIFIVHDRARYRGGEILVGRIREADIRAGKLVAPDSRLKLVAARGNPV